MARRNVLSLRLDDAEAAELARRAKAAGKTVSDFVRDAALHEPKPLRFTLPPIGSGKVTTKGTPRSALILGDQPQGGGVWLAWNRTPDCVTVSP